MASAARARASPAAQKQPPRQLQRVRAYYFNLPISVGPVTPLSGLTTLNDARMKVTVLAALLEPDASTSRPSYKYILFFFLNKDFRMSFLFLFFGVLAQAAASHLEISTARNR